MAAATRRALSARRSRLSARLMAVADVYDALISRRIYCDADVPCRRSRSRRIGCSHFDLGCRRRLPGHRGRIQGHGRALLGFDEDLLRKAEQLARSDGLPVIARRGR